MKGLYIVFEGGEYVGKSTQAREVAENLGAQRVREPGSTPIGEDIRGLLLDPKTEKAAVTQVLLHASQRSELATTVIRPALEDGKHVVSDRSWISSAAYQGEQGVPFEVIRQINQFALGELIVPDLCFLLDADPEAVKHRGLGVEEDYYEGQEMEFHQALRQRFLEIGEKMGAILIDATQDVDTVTEQISQSLSKVT